MLEENRRRPFTAQAEDFFIERPRLLVKLDRCNSRTVVLVAPPGYGKTTLIRQWVRSRDITNSWYTIGSEGSDIVTVATKTAQAISVLVPSAGERMLYQLANRATPYSEYLHLAEVLATDAVPWPIDAWLILDDCHLLSSSVESNQFIHALLRNSDIRSICLGRDRPSWVGSRSRMYGDTLEIGRRDLTMTFEESCAVLAPRSDESVRHDLARLCQGWPAVIGLAARSPNLEFSRDALPPELYDFFAEELFESASPALQRLLCQLSISLTLAIDVLELIPNAANLIEEAERLGFVSKGTKHDEWSIHPLLRAFLLRELREHPNRDLLISEIASVYFSCDRADEVWELIKAYDRKELIEQLIASSLSSFLDHRRLARIKSWVEFGRSHDLDSPMLDLVESELAFLAGDHSSAHLFSLHAAQRLREPSHARHLSLSIAGQSAYFLDRLDTAVDLLTEALSLASTPDSYFSCAWTRFLCFYELEDPSCFSEYESLNALRITKPDALLRLFQARLLLGSLDGPFAVNDLAASRMSTLLDRVCLETKTGYLFTYANALTLFARFDEAETVISSLLSELESSEYRFGLPSTYLMRARIAIGCRRYRQAEGLLEVVKNTPVGDLRYVKLSILALRNLITLLKGKKIRDESRYERQLTEGSLSLRYYESILALGHACHGDIDSVERFCERAERGALNSGVRTLVGLTRAIGDIQRESPNRAESIDRAITYACERGQWEMVVWSYRAYPRLLDEVASNEALARLVAPVLAMARDEALGETRGIEIDVWRRVDEHVRLTRKENEVLRLVADGLTNREIAERLFICEVTVKVHLRHIFRKLGVKSRTEAALLLVDP